MANYAPPGWRYLASLHRWAGVGNIFTNSSDIILAYHAVEGAGYGNISRKTFRSHMELLEEFEVVDLPTIYTEKSNQKRVALTFDDGTADFQHNVVPVLQEYGFPATVFLIGKVFEETNFQQDSDFTYEYMTTDTVRSLIDNEYVTLGSHTYSHPFLPDLSVDQQREEIIKGKESLENEFGVSIDRFCYPYFAHDSTAADIVAESHEYGVTGGGPSEMITDQTHRATLPRLDAALGRTELQWDMHDASTLTFQLTDRVGSLLP